MDNSQSPFVLSLDIGTSSVRSKIFDATGSEVPGLGIQIPYNMIRTVDGGEFIEIQDLMRLIFHTIDHACVQAMENHLSIAAVCCCTFWHNVAGIDAGGQPLTPLLSWSDIRPEIVLEKLREKIDPLPYTQRTGCPFHSSYYPAKIMWLRQVEPETIRQVKHWMSIGEYLYYQITGQRVCSYSMASGTGLLDSTNCQWDPATLEPLDLPLEMFSELRDAHQGIVEMRQEFLSRWPNLKGAIWYPAIGDGAASNIGCGCTTPDRFSLMVGTSGAMRVIWRGEYRTPPSGLWCYRIDRDHLIQGGALSNGGNFIDWMAKSLSLPGLDEVERQIQTLPPDSHGLTWLPFLAGQRSPRWNSNSCGVLHGLRLSSQPIQIFQSGLETVCYRFRLIHSLLKEHASPEHVLVATGGGLLRSPAWIQMMADVLGHDVCTSEVLEASARGAALVALQSLGVWNDFSQANPHLGEVYHPRPGYHAAYNTAFKRHIEMELAYMAEND